jgi:limonene 1,2-monooxygenase
MMGVGPGALTTDALMMGIDPTTQRPRMDEALGIILRLFTETEPITYESDWFQLHNARVHLRPFTYPHMPIAVAALQSPSGPSAAGKYGAGLLSLSLPRGGNEETALRQVWDIAESSAAAHERTADRNDWRLVVAVHLSDSREQAFAEARIGAGRYQRSYFGGDFGRACGLRWAAGRDH